MLKAAIIIERAEIGLGGAERSVSELAGELRRQDVEATILAAKGTASDDTIVLCGDYPGKRVRLKVFEAALRAHFKTHSYDIIHSTLPLGIADVYQPRGGSYREAMLGHIASYSCPCRRILKRGTHWLNFRRTEYLKAEKQVCTRSPLTVAALSGLVKTHFQKHYHLPDERIAVIPNGIDTDIRRDTRAADKIKDDILASVSIPADRQPIFFLFAANNPQLKGIGALLKTMQDLLDQPAANVYPVLVTAGAKKIRTGTANVVSLGNLGRICDALSVCDAAVLPTWYDPCSRFILEALAMGKPVITTRFNGAAERFEHQKHGIILDRPDDIAGLAAAIRLFCDREKIELARNAIVDDNLKEHVSISKHVNTLIALYESVIKNRDGGVRTNGFPPSRE